MNPRLQLLTALLLATALLIGCEDATDTTIPAPTIYFSDSGDYEIGPEDTITLSPKITYDRNSTYCWLSGDTIISTELELDFWSTALTDYTLTFIVDNAQGSDTFVVSVSVVEHMTMSEFLNHTVTSTKALTLLPDSASDFQTDHVIFRNYIESDTSMWYSFASCNIVAELTTISTSAIGRAYDTSSSTSNAYLSASLNLIYTYATADFDRAYTIKSVDVANDNFAYLTSKYGYTTESTTVSSSSEDDYCRLKFVGLDANGNETRDAVYHYLIDCRYDNPAKYVRQNGWETVDLKELGTVYGLHIYFESTQNNFPQLFCIDNLKLQD